MAHAIEHSRSSVRRWGGNPYDYVRIHQWIDASKVALADHRHRALRHHTLGVFWCEEQFGVTITNSDDKEVPVRLIAEKHIIEDLGFVPTVQDWLENMRKEFWMTGRKLISENNETTDSPKGDPSRVNEDVSTGSA